MDVRIYRGTGILKMYKEWVEETNTVSFVIHNRKLNRTYNVIYITDKLLESSRHLAEENNRDINDTLVEQTAKTISHEAMHLAISEIAGVDASMMYDRLTGGISSKDSSAGGTWNREDILP